MKKTIFLTGSKGFIGKHLYEAIKHDYDVICGGYNELPPFGVDYIIHLAAVTTTTDTFLPELYENNIVYAKQIMSIPTRIIYASSTSAAELTNPYSYTKRYIEHLGTSVNSVGLRFFNVYGNGNNKGIVKKAIECVKSGEGITIAGGSQMRDFIYIDDVVKAIIDNLDSPEKIIDIGTGHPVNIEEALGIIEEVTGGKIHAVWVDAQNTDMKYSVASPGIEGCLSFEEGLRRMIND